jgi:hypothetical protein
MRPGELIVIGRFFDNIGIERGELEPASALLRMPVTRVVDDQTTHRPRGVGHEPRTIRKGNRFAARHVQECLVQDGRGAQRSRRVVAPQFALGEAVQLGVERLEQLLAGCPVTVLGRSEERGELRFQGVRS